MSADKGYRYALALVDVAARYKDVRSIKTKSSSEVAAGFRDIYKRDKYLDYPKQIGMDKGKEFYGEVTTLFKEHNTVIYRSHGLTSIVERFNKTLAERLFNYQYHEEMKKLGTRNTEWIKQLPHVVRDINESYTRMIGKSPVKAMSEEGSIIIKTLL